MRVTALTQPYRLCISTVTKSLWESLHAGFLLRHDQKRKSELKMTNISRTVPDYHLVLPFEANFDSIKSQLWISDWFIVPVVSCILYVVLVFVGQRWMRCRATADLRRLLVLWNASLAIFSLAVCLRLVPELVHVLRYLGWRHSICSVSLYFDSSVSGLWSYLFVLSKLAELVDTLFLILRKKPVSFLHWFHHCSVLVFTWFLLKDLSAIGRWFMNMNAVVHTVMYSYYTLTALHIKLPRNLKLSVTALQICQMVFGCFISYAGFIHWAKGELCDISGTAAISAITIYGFYLVLFMDFFVRAYIVPKPTARGKKAS